jgi:transcriptional regulator with XRE-family HTH domain
MRISMAVRSARTKMIAATIRAEMLRRGWKAKDLGERIGVSADHITNVICGAVRSATAERLIEAELGRPLWSSQVEFSARQREGAEASAAASKQHEQGDK